MQIIHIPEKCCTLYLGLATMWSEVIYSLGNLGDIHSHGNMQHPACLLHTLHFLYFVVLSFFPPICSCEELPVAHLFPACHQLHLCSITIMVLIVHTRPCFSCSLPHCPAPLCIHCSSRWSGSWIFASVLPPVCFVCLFWSVCDLLHGQ